MTQASASEFTSGWRTLFGSFLGISLGVSSVYFYSLGIFIKPMAAEFGWGRGAASLGALVGTACAALTALPMGRLVDRRGGAVVGIASVALVAAGFAALGWLTRGLASFLLLTAIMSLLTTGSTPLSFTRLVIERFERSRGLALGIALAGSGAGAILIPALLAPFVATHGWRAGYLSLALVILVLLPVLLGLIGRADRSLPVMSTSPPLSIRQLLGRPPFARLAVLFFLVAMSVLGTVVHFIPMLTDWGLSPSRAGSTTALVGVAAIGGRLAAGAALDRFAPTKVAAALFLFAASGMVALALTGAPGAIFAALLLGLTVGAEVDLIAFMVGYYFAKPTYGQTYGALYTAFLVGGALGPVSIGYLQQQTGSYGVPLWVSAGMLGGAAMIALGTQRT